jgi:WD40-like Beta Propeller Repeat
MTSPTLRCSLRVVMTSLLLITAACSNLPFLQPPAAPTAEPPTSWPTLPPMPTLAPTLPPTAEHTATPTPLQTASGTQPTGQPGTGTETPALPTAAPTNPPPAGPQLAFLKDKDIWLLDQPGGQPYQLTVAGDILSFAWAPGGERLAAFNGKTLCIVNRDGSVRTACLDLGLNEIQSQIERQIIWSPDSNWIVLWNPVNPWDEGAIGWYIIALDSSGSTYRIEDPVDWGASLAPNNEAGGITGQPVFLINGQLVGTLTHRYLCGASGCHYQLYEFNFNARSFAPYPNKPEEGWSEGQTLALSQDGRFLVNFGTFFSGCESFTTFMDAFDLAASSRKSYDLAQEALAGIALSPDMFQAVISRISGCGSQDQTYWNQTCGLSQGFEVFPMQTWDLAEDQRSDLPPGLAPVWSPDGAWLAFRSCLAQGSQGDWQSDAATPASIYLLEIATGKVTSVTQGTQPAWRPK